MDLLQLIPARVQAGDDGFTFSRESPSKQFLKGFQHAALWHLDLLQIYRGNALFTVIVAARGGR